MGRRISNQNIPRFLRERLPAPKSFYEDELGQLSRPNRAGWCACRCPFHHSRSGKSFAIHVDGAFVCRGCGVKGGSVISFLRLRYGLNFKQACQRLGAWEDGGHQRSTKVRPGPLVPYLVWEFTIDGVTYRAEVNDEPKTELQLHRRLYADARDRLHELHQGAAEQFENEEELQWGIFAASWELIEMEARHG
jgi:hypothetical protein